MPQEPMTFYVYEHWRPDTDRPFYVGKGRGARAYYLKRQDNRHYMNVRAKLDRAGLKVQALIIADNLTEEEAFTLEVERIRMWREAGVKLTNQNDGGTGSANPSAEVRAKMSAARKGKPGTRRGIKHSPETMAKIMRAAARRRGKHLSDEHKLKVGANSRKLWEDPEYKKKVSEGLKGRWQDPDYRARVSASRTGQKHSTERIEKRAAKLRGQKRSPEVREKFSQIAKGRKQTPESNAKRSATLKGRTRTAEHRAAISKGKRGKKMSAEYSAAHSRSRKAMWQTPEYRDKVTASRQTPEYREKQSKRQKGQPKSEEHKASLRAGWVKRKAKGIEHSPEARKKMSEASKAYWAERKKAKEAAQS